MFLISFGTLNLSNVLCAILRGFLVGQHGGLKVGYGFPFGFLICSGLAGMMLSVNCFGSLILTREYNFRSVRMIQFLHLPM